MKHVLFLALLFTGISTVTVAQDREGRQEKVKALYVAYITQQLEINESEAQKFWPVHAQFESEIKGLDMSMGELDRQQTVLNIKKKYQDRFSGLLGKERCDKFFRIDGEFRKRLIDELRRRRQEGPPPGGRRKPMR